jgi:hypothetical protein
MAILLVAGGALLFACSSDSDDDSDSSDPTPTASADEAEPTDSAAPTEDGSASSDSNSDLQNLAAGLSETPARVAYTFTADAGGETTAGGFTVFWLPPDQWRLDIEEAEGSVAVTYINTDDKTYLCSESNCFESPVQVPFPFIGYLTDPASLNAQIDSEISGVDFDESEDTIAGQSVTCFSTSVDSEDASTEYCFNDDGLLMRLDSGAAGATFTLEATSAETTVSDSDFELPFPVQDIPGL